MTGPWAGLPVAWSDDDTFDEKAYRINVANCCKVNVPGVYTGGTTGEFYATELDEFKAVARATVDECKKWGKPVMIGCSSTYTLGVIRRAAYARELGANAIQVAFPFWMEVRDDDIVPFLKDVAAAAEGMALSIYETTRSKKALRLNQHRAIADAVPNYLMVKANEGILGSTPDGCRALSEFVNVFVAEGLWAKLGPHGAKGCCSSVVFWNPLLTLELWKEVEKKNWQRVEALEQRWNLVFEFLRQFEAKGFTDTALDRLGGVASGFLKISLRSRRPYPSATEEDAETLRNFYRKTVPEMLK